MKKIFITLIAVSLVLVSLYAMAQSAPVPDVSFNASQLSEFNGQNGNKAYVAVDGIVYDVTPFGAWKGGKHKMGLTAGKDLSKEIEKSPHGKKILLKIMAVGYYKP